jgi:hypothetical protein
MPGFSWPSALSLMKSHYGFSRSAIPFWGPSKILLAAPAFLHIDLNAPFIPVAPTF